MNNVGTDRINGQRTYNACYFVDYNSSVVSNSFNSILFKTTTQFITKETEKRGKENQTKTEKGGN